MNDFKVQYLLWGYYVSALSDIATLVSEDRNYQEWPYQVQWDYNKDYLESVQLNGARPPEYFALWWVCEHKRRTQR